LGFVVFIVVCTAKIIFGLNNDSVDIFCSCLSPLK
jgi:hypothetical protein